MRKSGGGEKIKLDQSERLFANKPTQSKRIKDDGRRSESSAFACGLQSAGGDSLILALLQESRAGVARRCNLLGLSLRHTSDELR